MIRRLFQNRQFCSVAYWVSQYDGVFIVFNSDGRIVSWQFTKSGSFNEVRPILVALADSSNAQETVVNSVFIDNCCQWRGKLQEVFGTTCKVKLDIFHAIQRVVKKNSKKTSFSFTVCI